MCYCKWEYLLQLNGSIVTICFLYFCINCISVLLHMGVFAAIDWFDCYNLPAKFAICIFVSKFAAQCTWDRVFALIDWFDWYHG